MVVIPKTNARTGKNIWDITETILLHDESTVILQNSHLRLGDGAFCNAFANKNAKIQGAISEEYKQRNISIIGIGSAFLDGSIHNGMKLTNVLFDNMYCGKYKTSVFGGHGEGEIICRNLDQSDVKCLPDSEGVKILQK